MSCVDGRTLFWHSLSTLPWRPLRTLLTKWKPGVVHPLAAFFDRTGCIHSPANCNCSRLFSNRPGGRSELLRSRISSARRRAPSLPLSGFFFAQWLEKFAGVLPGRRRQDRSASFTCPIRAWDARSRSSKLAVRTSRCRSVESQLRSVSHADTSADFFGHISGVGSEPISHTCGSERPQAC